MSFKKMRHGYKKYFSNFLIQEHFYLNSEFKMLKDLTIKSPSLGIDKNKYGMNRSKALFGIILFVYLFYAPKSQLSCPRTKETKHELTSSLS